MARLPVPNNGRKRISAACSSCRRRKSKCDGKTPCSRCKRAGMSSSCQYSRPQLLVQDHPYLHPNQIPKAAANQQSQPSASPALPLGLLNSDHLHHDATPVAEPFTYFTDSATIVTWNRQPEHYLNGLSSPDEDSPVATTPQPASPPIGGVTSLPSLGPSEIWPPAQDMSSLGTESVEGEQGESDRQETQLMPNDNTSVDSATWLNFVLSLTVGQAVQLGFIIVPPSNMKPDLGLAGELGERLPDTPSSPMNNNFRVHFPSYSNSSYLPYLCPNCTSQTSSFSSLSPPAQDMSQQYAQHYQPTQLAGAGFSQQVTPAHPSYVYPQTPTYAPSQTHPNESSAGSNKIQKERRALPKESRQPAAASAQTAADSRIPTDSTQPLFDTVLPRDEPIEGDGNDNDTVVGSTTAESLAVHPDVESARQTSECTPFRTYSERAFVRAHGILFSKKSLEKLESSIREFIYGLDNHIARSTKRWLEPDYYISLANICAIMGYGNESNPVYNIIKQVDTGDSQVHFTTGSEMEPSVPKDLADALKLANGIHGVVLKRFKDLNILPYLHVTLAFLYHLTFYPKAMAYIAPEYPWELTAIMLNSLMDSIESYSRIESMHFPRPDKVKRGKQLPRPLPEDYAMRGLLWVDRYFPDGWFSDKIDDDEKYFEVGSMSEERRERVLYLGCRIAARGDGKWLRYDATSHQFIVEDTELEKLLKTYVIVEA